ncbi:uncharacterized protein LOC111287006 [Durio zibethinus]|uniref:Uncharacterized protein LOC111287006 n=1 Tax=Durio zibethinus TaxID=66656 RepID=A0A6P5XXE6_DURZI|nr:uncharacterized protein LOC111287006 [Durio zibethinus]
MDIKKKKKTLSSRIVTRLFKHPIYCSFPVISSAGCQPYPICCTSSSDEWFALRRNKLTTSTFSTALGFWKGKRRSELWNEKVFASEMQVLESPKRCAMEWSVLNEAAAIEQYRSIKSREASSSGFAIHSKEQFDWLGASPDGLLAKQGCYEESMIEDKFLTVVHPKYENESNICEPPAK